MILPLGGDVGGHKGFGLGMMVDILTGTLSGAGCSGAERVMRANGLVFTVYSIEHFTEMECYYTEVEDLIRHVRSSRPAPGVSGILVPGEPEFRTAQRREQEGIELDDTTWGYICEEARLLGLDAEAITAA